MVDDTANTAPQPEAMPSIPASQSGQPKLRNRRTSPRCHMSLGRTGLATAMMIEAATKPANVPPTSDHTPAPRYARGMVTQKLTTGATPVSTPRLKKRNSRYGSAAGRSTKAVEKIAADMTLMRSHS